jgi:mRNA-degrading endonuclease YafQ of YafQ-DinJ toxin-antitoxin module
MYLLVYTKTFDESYSKIIKGDQEKEKRTQKALNLLQQDPFYPSLKSHKVSTRNFGERWSSWIAGDLRIIWDFDGKQKLTILLLAITKHSGTHREYK